MKQAAAKAKAQRAEVKGRPAAANKIAASPRVPGTRDPRLALPKSLTKKGWDYSQYMNRDDAESDRRYFARQWTAAAKKDIQLRAELAAVRKKAADRTKATAASKSRVEASKQRLKEANDRLAGIRADIAQRKADFQKRFGMSYEESIARRGTAKKRKR